MTDEDEISLKEAASYVKPTPDWPFFDAREMVRGIDAEIDEAEAATRKREREIGEQAAILGAMLGASRRGKKVRR